MAYVQFAREHPHIFSLTLKPSDNDQESDSAHVQEWRFVLEHVSRVHGEKSAPKAAVALWAFLHGITVLEAAGAFGETKPSSSFEFGLSLWLNAASGIATWRNVVVEAVGPDVSQFKISDEIYGVTNPQFCGAQAEYAIASAGMVALN